MYISEFVCGVVVTLAVEFVVLIVAVVISERKKKK